MDQPRDPPAPIINVDVGKHVARYRRHSPVSFVGVARRSYGYAYATPSGRSKPDPRGSRDGRSGGRSEAERRRDALRIGEELQRGRCPWTAVTRRAHGGSGRSRRRSSSTMHGASPPPRFLGSTRKTHARDPLGSVFDLHIRGCGGRYATRRTSSTAF